MARRGFDPWLLAVDIGPPHDRFRDLDQGLDFAFRPTTPDLDPAHRILIGSARSHVVGWCRRSLVVRGKHKARAVLLWFALAHNMLRAFALRRAATVAVG